MNTHTILTLTEFPSPSDLNNASTAESIERLKVRIEGEIEPAKIIEIYKLLNAPSRRKRSDAGKARKEQQP